MDDKNNNHKDDLKDNEKNTEGPPYIALGIALGVAFGGIMETIKSKKNKKND
jgi:hypothetical protein